MAQQAHGMGDAQLMGALLEVAVHVAGADERQAQIAGAAQHRRHRFHQQIDAGGMFQRPDVQNQAIERADADLALDVSVIERHSHSLASRPSIGKARTRTPSMPSSVTARSRSQSGVSTQLAVRATLRSASWIARDSGSGRSAVAPRRLQRGQRQDTRPAQPGAAKPVSHS